MTTFRYLAAKTYYFGVGGGTDQFEEFINQKSVFSYETVKTYEKGKGSGEAGRPRLAGRSE